MNRIEAMAILKLNQTECTSIQKIKAAYYRQARRHHPDLGGDLNHMKLINIAYRTLLNNPVKNKPSSEYPVYQFHATTQIIALATLTNLNLFWAAYELSNRWYLTTRNNWTLNLGLT